MRTFEAPFKTTRGTLEHTLLALGFVRSDGENEFGFPYVEYTHPPSGAAVSLRVVPPEQAASDPDLLTSEHAVEWWGIADRKTFYRLLREATPSEMQAA